MMSFRVLALLLFCVCSAFIESCAESSDSRTFGSDLTTEFGENSNNVLFLNLDDPAQCNGTVTAYHYCYYYSSDDPEVTVVFMVYRRVGNRYRLIVGSQHVVQRMSSELESFGCEDEPLEESEQFEVQQGDVIAACLVDTSEVKPLPVHAQDANGHTIYSVDPNSESCLLPEFPLTVIDRDDLEERQDFALHLYADIVANIVLPTATPSITVATTGVDGTPLPTMATLQLQAPTGAPGSSGSGTDVVPIAVGVSVTAAVLTLITAAGIVVIVIALKRKRKKTFDMMAIDNIIYAAPSSNGTAEGMYAVLTRVSNSEEDSEPHYEFDSELHNGFPEPRFPTINYHHYTPSSATDAPTIYSESHYSTIGSESAGRDYAQLLELSQHRDNDIYRNMTPYHAPAALEKELYAELKSYGIRHIPKEHIEITHPLGSGQFGNVDKGIWTTPYGAVDVAVKTLSTGGDKVKFLQEAAIMAQFRHPNIVLLHGVVSRGNLMLVVELVHQGNLREFLLAMKPEDPAEEASEIPKLLQTFSSQIALGMQYLSSKGFIHRDLAARNILVSKDNICKVSDFGLSRDLETGEYYVSHGGKVPVKWTAPEALEYKKYSTASDVWSYGCLLYEIWSLGRKPFTGLANHEVLLKVTDGYRLPPPPGCPRKVYGLMIQCWHPDPSDRPDFRSLLLTLLEDKDSPLSLPEDAQVPHPLAGTLGAPLEAGEGLYPDLQKTHLQ